MTPEPPERPRPRAFRLDHPDVAVAEADEPKPRAGVVVTPEPPDEPEVSDETPLSRPRRRMRWAGLFWSGLGGLVSLAIGLWTAQLVDDLFSRASWLGWLGAVLAALVAVAAIAIVTRESLGLLRLARIEAVHDRALLALATDDQAAARSLATDLVGLYRTQPSLARARAAVVSAAGSIVDGADLVRVAERELMAPLDGEARRLIAEAARRVSIVTAANPRALVDVAVVSAESLRLVRRLATLYGGRPGTLGLLRLLRHAVGNLALAGGMAAGDQLLGSALGHGLASRISARLGEGVLNGLLIARLGLAASMATRPMPFEALPRPTLTDVAGGLMRRRGSASST